MNCFFVLPNLDAGGAERVSITIARVLKRNGHSVSFINMGIESGDMLPWIVPEFQLVSFGNKRVISAIPQLHKFMKQHADSIFFSSREHVNVVNLFAVKGTGAKTIVRIPNMPYNKLSKGLGGMKMAIIKTINKWLLKSAEYVIAQNEEMCNQILRYYALPKEKVVYINNPVDKDFVIKSAEGCENPFADNEKVFLAACTVDYRKGIDVLIKAWPMVKKKIKTAQLYIIGRDISDYASEVKKQAEPYSSISFLGFQGNPYPFLKYCDVFVLSSRMEGFPNVVLEAMCFNKPVASTTCVDVIKDIIRPGVNGFYCNIEDADALAETMILASQLKEIENNYDLFNTDRLLSLFQ